MNIITNWLQKQFNDPQILFLSAFLLAVFSGLIFLGDILAPVIISIVIAYLLEGLVQRMERIGCHHKIAVIAVYLGLLLLIILLVFGVVPQVTAQLSQLLQQIPEIITAGQALLLALPEQYPEYVSTTLVKDMVQTIIGELSQYGQQIVSSSVASVVGLFTIIIYLVLMPVLIFFFMMDRDTIIRWAQGFLPAQQSLVKKVWHDVNLQIGNYIRGKFWEIMILWACTYIAFLLLGLKYAMLLSVLVGLSVLVPYIGAAVVTVPVIMVAYSQWGFTSDFLYLVVVFFVLQALDGNLLVPLLFSEVNNLHPIGIVVAVLFFGGIWGFWGVFFAIPLANLVQAVVAAWPKGGSPQPASENS